MQVTARLSVTVARQLHNRSTVRERPVTVPDARGLGNPLNNFLTLLMLNPSIWGTEGLVPPFFDTIYMLNLSIIEEGNNGPR